MRRAAAIAILGWASVVLAPAWTAAAVEDYLGRPVASIRFDVEGRETIDPKFFGLIETRVGQPLSMAAVRDSIAHLFSLGQFEDVQVRATRVGASVALRYELVPVHPVSKIEFAGGAGAPGIDKGQLLRAVLDLYGTSPPVGRAVDMERVIEDVLRQRGYLHARATPRAEIGHAPERATLVFTIEPGPRTLIGAIDIAGTPTLPRPALLERLKLAPREPYEREVLSARVDKYVEDLRSRGYYEGRVEEGVQLSDRDRVANLTVTATPGPHTRLVFKGDALPSDKRDELVPVAREGSVDEDLLEDATNRIQDYFKAQGFRDATAPHARQETGGELVITFTIDKGRLYRVAHVEVSGNASVPLVDLESRLTLHDGQPFSDAKLAADLGTIENVYRLRGFAHAGAQATPRLQPAGETVSVIVPIDIQEGVRTLVGDVRLEGNQQVPEAKLRAGLGLEPGKPYVAEAVSADRDAIALHYMDLGYANATVDVKPTFNQEGTRADLVYTVKEGPEIRVDHILVVGNIRTSTETIEHELQIKPGDPWNPSAVTESERRLATLGLFRRVRITDLRHGDETSRDLLVTVEEAPATTLGYGGGFEAGEFLRPSGGPGSVATQELEFAPRASFDIGRRNLFGKNRSINLFSSVAVYPRDFPVFENQTSQTINGFTEYLVQATYREPRVLDTAGDLSVIGTLEQQIRSGFNFARRAVGASVGHRVTRHVSLTGGYQLERTQLFDVQLSPSNQALVSRLFSQTLLSSFSSSIIRDTRDDPVDPKTGALLSANGQLAARNIGSNVGFAKSFLRAQAFRPVPGGEKIVFAASARLGLASGFPRIDQGAPVDPADRLPPSERFFAGGDTSNRGFALDQLGTPATIDPNTGFPFGGNGLVIFNGELRVPVRGPLSIVGFVDTGNVFALASDISLGELRTAVGFGLRYRSPVGPLRIDLGFKVHRQVVAGQLESLTAVNIGLGQAF